MLSCQADSAQPAHTTPDVAQACAADRLCFEPWQLLPRVCQQGIQCCCKVCRKLLSLGLAKKGQQAGRDTSRQGKQQMEGQHSQQCYRLEYLTNERV